MTSSPSRGATRAGNSKKFSPWLRLLPGISPKRRSYVLAWYGFTLTSSACGCSPGSSTSMWAASVT